MRLIFTGQWQNGLSIRQWPGRPGFNLQVKSYQRLKKWYLMPPCLTLSIIRYGSRVKWRNPGKWVVPTPTLWYSSYRKRSLRVTLDNGRQLYFFTCNSFASKFGVRLLISSWYAIKLINKTQSHNCYYASHCEFFTPVLIGDLYLCSSDSKTSLVPLVRISVDCNLAVV